MPPRASVKRVSTAASGTASGSPKAALGTGSTTPKASKLKASTNGGNTAAISPTSSTSASPKKSKDVEPVESACPEKKVVKKKVPAAAAIEQAPEAAPLQVGQRVLWASSTGKFEAGTLKFKGPTQFGSGEWCGVELDNPLGKNNGSVQDVSYFECRESHGIFVREAKLLPEETSKPAPVKKKKKVPASTSGDASPTGGTKGADAKADQKVDQKEKADAKVEESSSKAETTSVGTSATNDTNGTNGVPAPPKQGAGTMSKLLAEEDYDIQMDGPSVDGRRAETLEKLWHRVDRDGDGLLSLEEFGNFVMAIADVDDEESIPANYESLKQQNMTDDGSTGLDFGFFVDLCGPTGLNPTNASLVDAIAILEQTASGERTQEEVKAALRIQKVMRNSRTNQMRLTRTILAPAYNLRRVLLGTSNVAVVCVLGGPTASAEAISFTAALSKALTRSSDFPIHYVVFGEEAGGVSGAFFESAEAPGKDGCLSRVVQQPPEGEPHTQSVSSYFAGRDTNEHRQICGRLGDIYITIEGDTELVQQVKVAEQSGAIILPVARCGGASSGLLNFPPAALEKPSSATEEQWALISEAKGSVEKAAAALAAVVNTIVGNAAQQRVATSKLKSAAMKTKMISSAAAALDASDVSASRALARQAKRQFRAEMAVGDDDASAAMEAEFDQLLANWRPGSSSRRGGASGALGLEGPKDLTREGETLSAPPAATTGVISAPPPALEPDEGLAGASLLDDIEASRRRMQQRLEEVHSKATRAALLMQAAARGCLARRGLRQARGEAPSAVESIRAQARAQLSAALERGDVQRALESRAGAGDGGGEEEAEEEVEAPADDRDVLRSAAANDLMQAYRAGALDQILSGVGEEPSPVQYLDIRRSACDALLSAHRSGQLESILQDFRGAPPLVHRGVRDLLKMSLEAGTLASILKSVQEKSEQNLLPEAPSRSLAAVKQEAYRSLVYAASQGVIEQALADAREGRLDAIRADARAALLAASRDVDFGELLKSSRDEARLAEIRAEARDALVTAALAGEVQSRLGEAQTEAQLQSIRADAREALLASAQAGDIQTKLAEFKAEGAAVALQAAARGYLVRRDADRLRESQQKV